VDSLLWDPRLDPTIRSADWQYLADLPVPPELERALNEVWMRRGPLTPPEKTFHEEELKMQYHFSGKAVLYVQTTRGRAVIASGPPDLEEIGRILEAMPRPLRTRTTLHVLEPWAERFAPEEPPAV
jgi:hypothetical protein